MLNKNVLLNLMKKMIVMMKKMIIMMMVMMSVCSAPPEFVQWPQSVSRPAGGSAVFSCTASGVPEPHLIWLKNGKLLTPSGNVKLTNGNT